MMPGRRRSSPVVLEDEQRRYLLRLLAADQPDSMLPMRVDDLARTLADGLTGAWHLYESQRALHGPGTGRSGDVMDDLRRGHHVEVR